MHFKTDQTNQYQENMGLYSVPYDSIDRHTHPDQAISVSYLTFLPELSDSYTQKTKTDESLSSSFLPSSPIGALTEGAAHEPLGDFLTGKRKFLTKSVKDALGLIYERERLKDSNLHQIDYSSMQMKERLFEIEDWRAGTNSQIDKVRANIDRELLSFEREKRFEEVACWRDVTRLKSELREMLGDLDRETRRERLLGGYAP
jgi:hypothetical protein